MADKLTDQEELMRAPKRKRPMRRVPVEPPDEVSIPGIAERVRYVGSPEHKSYPSFAGEPKLRADASRCDPSLGDPDELTSWLRAGILAGQFGGPWAGLFPRYVWYVEDDVCYEGRLTNAELGHYKGYPLRASERPIGL